MEKSLLWQLLNTLDSPAWRELEKMVQAPYFNTRPDVADLFRYLSAQRQRGNCPSREAVFSELYGPAPWDAARLRTVLHALAELVRHYLVWTELTGDPEQYQGLLARALRARDLPELSAQALRRAGQHLESAPTRDTDWHDRRFQLQAEQLRAQAGGARSQELNLQELSDHLERGFVLKKLKLACELISHQTVFPKDYHFGLLDQVLAYVRERGWVETEPDVALYYYCCLALLKADEKQHFEALYPLLLQAGQVFPHAECRDLFLLAINYCIRKVNEGQTSFAQQGLKLYQHAIETGYLLDKGQLSRYTFRNAVGMGLKIRAFDWVEEFIGAYSDRIAPEHRDAMVRFNRARLAYSRRQFGQALGLLSHADFDDVLLHLAAKTLLLKICYEAGEWRLLESALDALDVYLRRKKIIGYHRDNYRRVVRTFRKLLALNRFDVVALQRLRSAVEADVQLSEREWFLAQLPETKHRAI